MLARQLGLYKRPEIRCNWCGKNNVYHWYKEHVYVCMNTFCPYLLRNGKALHLDAKSDLLKYNFHEIATALERGFKTLDFRQNLQPKLNHSLGFNTHNIVNRFL